MAADTYHSWPGMAEGRLFSKYPGGHWDYDANKLTPVTFRNRTYRSASDALEEYINEHEGKDGSKSSPEKNRKYENEIEDLLLSQASLRMYGDGEGLEGQKVAARAETQRLSSVQSMVDEAYQRLLAARANSLQDETVEEALNRSQKVLEEVAKDDFSLPGSTVTFKPLSTESVTTDTLVHTEPITVATVEREFRSSLRSSQNLKKGEKTSPVQTPKTKHALSRLRNFKHDLDRKKNFTQKGQRSEWQAGGEFLPPGVSTSPPGVSTSPPSWVDDLATSDISYVKDTHTSKYPDLSQISEADRRQTLSVNDLFSDSPARDRKERPGQGHRGQGRSDLAHGLSDSMFLSNSTRQKLLSTPQKKMIRDDLIKIDAHFELTPVDTDDYSLTTDDLILRTPDGQKETSARKRTPQTSHTVKFSDEVNKKQHENDFVQKELRGMTHSAESKRDGTLATASFEGSMQYEPYLAASTSFREKNHNFILERRKIDSNLLDLGQPATCEPNPELSNEQHRQYIRQLMEDIEDSSSSVVTAVTAEFSGVYPMKGSSGAKLKTVSPDSYGLGDGFVLPYRTAGPSGQPTVEEQEAWKGRMASETPGEESYGFLTRIQNLLAYSPSGGNKKTCDDLETSPETEVILDGDRPWESSLPPLKPPKYIQEEVYACPVSPKNKGRIVDSFMEDCLASAKEESETLTGRAQPGSMEALKNILFTVQTMVPPGEEKKDHATSSGEIESLGILNEQKGMTDERVDPKLQHLLSNSFEEPPSSQSLERAMQHLSKLKTLVGKQTK